MVTPRIQITRIIPVGEDMECVAHIRQGDDARTLEAHSAEHGLPRVLVCESKDGDGYARIDWPNADHCTVHVPNYASALGYFARHAESVKYYAYKGVAS